MRDQAKVASMPIETLHSESSLAVSIRGLHQSYGLIQALSEVNLDLNWGEALVVFGQNGAGKTTLLRTLALLTRPQAGKIFIAGYDSKEANRVRSRIGFLSHESFLYDELSPWENLSFYGRLNSLGNLDQCVSTALERVGMTPWAHHRTRTLSNGMQKRVALARTLLHNPKVLLLDEPEAGLDQPNREALTQIIRQTLGKGFSIILTTHDLDWGLSIADRVVMLVQGSIALDQPRREVKPTSLKQLFKKDRSHD